MIRTSEQQTFDIQDLAYKLHDRAAKCHREIGEIDRAKESTKVCLHSLSEAKLNPDKRETLRKNIESFHKELSNLKNTKTKSPLDQPELKSPNKHFPAFSSAVQVKYEAGRGRFGVAGRSVRLGELLCVETPAVSVLHPDCGLSCTGCFRQTEAPLPSPFTSKVVFCSRYRVTSHSTCYNSLVGSVARRPSSPTTLWSLTSWT